MPRSKRAKASKVIVDLKNHTQTSNIGPVKVWADTRRVDFDLTHVVKSTKFLNWVNRFNPKLGLSEIEVQSALIVGGNKLIFAYLKVTTIGYGTWFVFFRGDAVAVLVVLVEQETLDLYTILTVQPRIPTGDFCKEIPAGMVDEQTGEFAGVAANELVEETGIKIQESDLVHLITYGPSFGGCDELVAVYLYRTIMPREKILEFQGKLTGLVEHGEKITLQLIRLNDILLPQYAGTDSKAIIAYGQYLQQYLHHGQI